MQTKEELIQALVSARSEVEATRDILNVDLGQLVHIAARMNSVQDRSPGKDVDKDVGIALLSAQLAFVKEKIREESEKSQLCEREVLLATHQMHLARQTISDLRSQLHARSLDAPDGSIRATAPHSEGHKHGRGL
jgi:predicted oxidoreductase